MREMQKEIGYIHKKQLELLVGKIKNSINEQKRVFISGRSSKGIFPPCSVNGQNGECGKESFNIDTELSFLNMPGIRWRQR